MPAASGPSGNRAGEGLGDDSDDDRVGLGVVAIVRVAGLPMAGVPFATPGPVAQPEDTRRLATTMATAVGDADPRNGCFISILRDGLPNACTR